MIEKKILKYIMYVTTALIALTAVLSGLFLGLRWSIGFIIGALWSLLNFSLTIRIVESILNKKLRKRLYLALIFKFPVLYLLGFYVLISKTFPFTSLLSGVPMVFCALAMVNLWQKRIRHNPSSLIS